MQVLPEEICVPRYPNAPSRMGAQWAACSTCFGLCHKVQIPWLWLWNHLLSFCELLLKLRPSRAIYSKHAVGPQKSLYRRSLRCVHDSIWVEPNSLWFIYYLSHLRETRQDNPGGNLISLCCDVCDRPLAICENLTVVEQLFWGWEMFYVCFGGFWHAGGNCLSASRVCTVVQWFCTH